MIYPVLNEQGLDDTMAAIIKSEQDRKKAKREGKPLTKARFWSQEVWLAKVSVGKDHAEIIKPGIKCGTAMCLAGWATVLHGARFHDDEMVIANRDDERFNNRYPEHRVTKYIVYDDGKKIQALEISERARRVLGLTRDEAADLFNGDNTLADLKRIIKRIKRGDYRG